MESVQQLKAKVNELFSLLEAFKQLTSNLEVQDVFQNILLQMVQVVKAEAGTLWVLDNKTEELTVSAAYGPTASKILHIRMKKDEGIVGRVITTGEPELIEDVSKHPFWAKHVDQSSGFVTNSMITVPLIAKGKVLGALQLLNKQNTSFFNKEDINLALILAHQSALALHNSQMYDEVNKMFLSMIETLAKTLDARDPYTAGHSERVAIYSVLIARRLGMDEFACDELYKAAMLHDIGKIGVPDSILLKHSRLTDEEFEQIKQHTVIGANILSNMEPKNSMVHSIQTARFHHEKMNGTGYPDRLKGDEIPLFARIVGVADAFDAMTTVRPYSNGLTFQKAAEELIRCKNTMFDAEIVDAFTALLREVNYNFDEISM